MNLNDGQKKENKAKIIAVFEEIFHRRTVDNKLTFSNNT